MNKRNAIFCEFFNHIRSHGIIYNTLLMPQFNGFFLYFIYLEHIFYWPVKSWSIFFVKKIHTVNSIIVFLLAVSYAYSVILLVVFDASSIYVGVVFFFCWDKTICYKMGKLYKFVWKIQINIFIYLKKL